MSLIEKAMDSSAWREELINSIRMPAHPWMTGITQTVQWAIAQLPAHPARPEGQSPVAMTPLSATVAEGPDDRVRLDLGRERSLVKVNNAWGIRMGMTINVLAKTIRVGHCIPFDEQGNRDRRYTSTVVSIVWVDGGYHIQTAANHSIYFFASDTWVKSRTWEAPVNQGGVTELRSLVARLYMLFFSHS